LNVAQRGDGWCGVTRGARGTPSLPATRGVGAHRRRDRVGERNMALRRWGVCCGRWLTSTLAALALAAGVATPALAHGLFRDGDPADVLQDALLNFAIPLVVLVAGAVAGILLSKWLARGATEPDQDGDEALEADEATTKA
jgi:hypothetical protein